MNTPVALIIFNRPEVTARVFEVLRPVRPTRLFVIADGPRPDVPEDFIRCQETRAIIDTVDWPCELHKNYSEVNLGCGLRPVTGISWVFEHVDKAIILEDDCLPHSTFFDYCTELLERYHSDQRIMHIAGNNRGFSQKESRYSYYYSLLPYCWGWATWRRAWQLYDFDLGQLPEVTAGGLLDNVLHDRRVARYWEKRFWELKKSRRQDIWDFQWTFSCWVNRGLSIVPNVNLVRNIGFGKDATHTKRDDARIIALKEKSMDLPLIHPPHVIRDSEVDQAAFQDIENGFFYRYLYRWFHSRRK